MQAISGSPAVRYAPGTHPGHPSSSSVALSPANSSKTTTACALQGPEQMLSSCTRWHFVGCWLLTTAITNSAWNKSPPQGDKLIIFAPTAPQLAASCSFLPKTAVSQLTATCPPASFVPQKRFLPPSVCLHSNPPQHCLCRV